MGSINDTIFARDEYFWNNYLTGRPTAPTTFFDRILLYHEEQGGRFNTVHDCGAGNGPYAKLLRSRFKRVIVSDIAAENVKLAQERLGTDGFQFRVAKVEEAPDIPAGTVDMVFATNVMHFADQQDALEAIAKQLRPGGTLVVAGFAAARLYDEKVQETWQKINYQGGRLVLQRADDPLQLMRIMERSQGSYNVVPLDERLFKAGALRIHLNMDQGGLTGLLPPEENGKAPEPNYTGKSDIEVYEKQDGWQVKTDLEGLKKHFESFPFSALEPSAYTELWNEMGELLKNGRVVEGVFPAKLILATRR